MIASCQLGGILFAAVAAIFWLQSAAVPMVAVTKVQTRGPVLISGGKLRGGQYLFASPGDLSCDVTVEALA